MSFAIWRRKGITELIVGAALTDDLEALLAENLGHLRWPENRR
jgi:hypothetical protein